MPVDSIEFWRDWQFWLSAGALAISIVALGFSSRHQVNLWIKGFDLDFEISPRISLTHKIGNPNTILLLEIENTGGEDLKITDLRAKFWREGEEILDAPIYGTLQEGQSESADWQNFLNARLKPSGVWSRHVNFVGPLNREDEDRFSDITLKITKAILDRLPSENSKDAVEIDSVDVARAHKFFDEKFLWDAGDYKMEISIWANGQQKSKTFRFMLHESQSNRLKLNKEGYKTGNGIYWDDPLTVKQIAVRVEEI